MTRILGVRRRHAPRYSKKKRARPAEAEAELMAIHRWEEDEAAPFLVGLSRLNQVSVIAYIVMAYIVMACAVPCRPE